MNELLIVDDEAELAELLGTILKSNELNTNICFNAKDGIKLLQEKKIDCIVSDLSMPVMSGVDFLKKIRQMGFKIPFIIYTAFGSDENALEAAKYGCYDFIEKPKTSGLKQSVTRAIQDLERLENMDLEKEYKEIYAFFDKKDEE